MMPNVTPGQRAMFGEVSESKRNKSRDVSCSTVGAREREVA